MEKFCGKCGSKLNKKTGNCPKCNKLMKQEKKTKKSVELTKIQKVRKFFLKLFITIFFIMLLSGGALGILTYYKVVDIPVINKFFDLIEFNKNGKSENDKDMLEAYKVSAPDAESYYEQNSKVVSKINAKDSKQVYTEAETVTFFERLNFTQYPITTNYSMEGEYCNDVDISDKSSEKHPMYQTYYFSETGDLWIIYLINETIMATPVSYNMQSELGVELVISETETVTSYDSITNKFYQTIPNKSELMVIVMDKIDAKTLEQLTIGELDNYVQNQM